MLDTGFKLIRLFQRMADGLTLRDSPSKGLRLDEREEYERATVETLCDFDFLLPENGISEEGEPCIEYKLSEKAYRLVDELKARKSEENDPRPRERHFWILVANGNVFIDLGVGPPDLKILIGEDWNNGDRIAITCHNPEAVLASHHLRLASHLRVALASEVYGGLSSHEIDEIEKIATDRNAALEHSST